MVKRSARIPTNLGETTLSRAKGDVPRKWPVSEPRARLPILNPCRVMQFSPLSPTSYRPLLPGFSVFSSFSPLRPALVQKVLRIDENNRIRVIRQRHSALRIDLPRNEWTR